MAMARLRMGQSLTAIFYLPHLVAQEVGAFREEGLAVEFVTSFGRQWALLERGEVDLAIGGPTRNMALYLSEEKRIVNFCAALCANTWFLLGRQPAPQFAWTDLVGRTVIGLANDAQGTCLRWILLERGIDPDRVKIVAGENTAAELEDFRAGLGDYLLHSLHTAAPLVAAGAAVPVQELASPSGPVLWSTYAALPETLRTRRAELEAFTRGIARALAWIAAEPPAAIAALLRSYFPDWTLASLTEVIATYHALGTWPRDPLISRADWDRYSHMHVAAGALPRPVPYEPLVDPSFAEHAMTRLAQARG